MFDRNFLMVLAVSTAAQMAMVLIGHWMPAVANLFGPLGVLISLLAGLLYARGAPGSAAKVWGMAALVGGLCALIGIALSYALGDVTAMILVFGTLGSAVGGLIGGFIGRFMAKKA